MPTLATTSLTLADLAKRQKKDGSIDKIVELLSAQFSFLNYLPWVASNDGTGHKTTVRSGLPKGTWRNLNYGVQPEKSTTVQIRDVTGMLESYAVVDKALVSISKDKTGFMLSEHKAYIEGMSQTMATQMIYGDATVDPEKITGLAPRYSSKTAENGVNIIDAGGTGSDNTSIWILCLGEDTIHGIYPDGTVGGLKVGATKEETLTDAAGGLYEGYRTHYSWFAGLTVRDWRYGVRIANIDVSDLTKNATTGADLVDLIVQGIEMLPDEASGRMVILCNRTIRSMLRRQISNKDNVWLSMDEVGGKKVLSFDLIPVERVTAILNTEARVV